MQCVSFSNAVLEYTWELMYLCLGARGCHPGSEAVHSLLLRAWRHARRSRRCLSGLCTAAGCLVQGRSALQTCLQGVPISALLQSHDVGAHTLRCLCYCLAG